jgi:tetratricopeptide (TPR) repeat protein
MSGSINSGLAILLLLCSMELYAQSDVENIISRSLEIELPDQPGFLTKSAESFFRSNLMAADTLCKKALQISEELNNDTLIAQSHKYLAFINRNMGYYIKALDHSLESNRLYLILKDSLESGFTFSIVGTVYSNLGDKEKALEALIKGERIYKALLKTDPDNKAIISRLAILYNDIGLFYYKQKEDYFTPITYFNQALELANKIADSMQITSLIANIGMVYFEKEDYKNAVDNFEKSLIMAKELGNRMFAANIMSNLALCYIKEGDVKKAREFLMETLKIYTNLHAVKNYGRTQSSIASTWFIEEKYKKAINWYLSSLPPLVESGSYLDLINSYYKLSICYTNDGNTDSALYFLNNYTSTKDSVNEAENEKRYQELFVAYETEKKEKENELLKVTNERQRNIQMFLIVLVFVIILVVVLMFLNFRQYKKTLMQKKKLAEKEKENLKTKLEFKNKELTTNAMYLVNLNLLSESIIKKIREILPATEECNQVILYDIIKEIEQNIQKDAWKEFEIRFEEVHNDFYHRLLELHENLSPTEIKTCAFLRLNMTSKEIAALTFKSHRTVEKSRTDIRKKMNLSKETNLVNYLAGI